MVKLITFLGTADYKPTTYRFEEGTEETRYFPIAAAKFFRPEKTFVFVTAEAQTKHESAFREEFNHCAVEFVSIQDGKNAQELWDLFEKLVENLQDGDEVIFDVTFGYRSIPILATIGAAYIQVARDVKIRHLIYGAWDARDKNGVTPVFDLTPFLSLLDWITATHLFLRTGNADELAKQLRDTAWAEREQIATLDEATAALRLARPDEARERAYLLSESFAELSPTTPDALPFQMLLQQVQEEFKKIAPVPVNPSDLVQQLRAEYALIEWNFQRGQLLSAITIAREWLVSSLCWRLAPSPEQAPSSPEAAPVWRTQKVREKAEKGLGSLYKLANLGEIERKKKLGSEPELARKIWQDDADYAKKLGQAWNLVHHLRNDLNHAGMVHTTPTRSLTQALSQIEESRKLLEILYKDAMWNQPPKEP